MGKQGNRWPASRRRDLLAYCMLSGAAATLAGAAVSLLADGATTRSLVWLAVTATVACAAGVWWGRNSPTERRRMLGRILRSGYR